MLDIIEHMFEASWIEELSAGEAADELARVRELVVAAEATQFALAAHWADLHAPELVEEVRRSLPGMPRAVRCGPDGCPEIEEYAGAELEVLLGRSTTSGEQLLRDAVTVRHRHPQLWAGIRDRKSTRLNSSHANISYAVFCLKKKTTVSNRLSCGTRSLT